MGTRDRGSAEIREGNEKRNEPKLFLNLLAKELGHLAFCKDFPQANRRVHVGNVCYSSRRAFLRSDSDVGQEGLAQPRLIQLL